MNPTISIIIPTYNRAAELARALDSLVAQTYDHFETIVCDDGSEEDIAAVVARYNCLLNIRYLRIDRSGGPARPRNVAMKASTGDWLSYLDSDDWWDPSRLERVVKRLNSSDVDVVYHRLKVIGAHGGASRTPAIGSPVGRNPLVQMIVRGNPIPNSAAVVRRETMKVAGYFNETPELVSLEDFDRWLTIARIGGRFSFIDEALGYYWIGADNISTVKSSMISRRDELHRLQIDTLPNNLRELAKSYFAYENGSISIRLRDPVLARKYFSQINPLSAPVPWIKCRIKMLIPHWRFFNAS